MTADRTTFMTVEELAAAKQHVNAVLASGILDQHERAHLIEVRTVPRMPSCARAGKNPDRCGGRRTCPLLEG